MWRRAPQMGLTATAAAGAIEIARVDSAPRLAGATSTWVRGPVWDGFWMMNALWLAPIVPWLAYGYADPERSPLDLLYFRSHRVVPARSPILQHLPRLTARKRIARFCAASRFASCAVLPVVITIGLLCRSSSPGRGPGVAVIVFRVGAGASLSRGFLVIVRSRRCLPSCARRDGRYRVSCSTLSVSR